MDAYMISSRVAPSIPLSLLQPMEWAGCGGRWASKPQSPPVLLAAAAAAAAAAALVPLVAISAAKHPYADKRSRVTALHGSKPKRPAPAPAASAVAAAAAAAAAAPPPPPPRACGPCPPCAPAGCRRRSAWAPCPWPTLCGEQRWRHHGL